MRSEEELLRRREAQARYVAKFPEKAALQKMRAMAKRNTWTPTEKWLQRHGTDCADVNKARAIADLPSVECKPLEALPKPRPTLETRLWSLAEVMDWAKETRPEKQPLAVVAGDRITKSAKGPSVASIKQYIGRLRQLLKELKCSQDEPVTCLLDTDRVIRTIAKMKQGDSRTAKTARANIAAAINGINKIFPPDRQLPAKVVEAYKDQQAEEQEGSKAVDAYVSENVPPKYDFNALQSLHKAQIKADKTSDETLMGYLYLSGKGLPPTRYNYHDVRFVQSASEIGPHDNVYIVPEDLFVIRDHKTAKDLGELDIRVKSPRPFLKMIHDRAKTGKWLFPAGRGDGHMSKATFGQLYRETYHGILNTRRAFVTKFVKHATSAERIRLAKGMAHSPAMAIRYERADDIDPATLEKAKGQKDEDV